jgi:hypothetical protein
MLEFSESKAEKEQLYGDLCREVVASAKARHK